MDTHCALIAMGGVGARLLDHGQRVRFALKMGLWGKKWQRASAARADGKNVSMHLCSFGTLFIWMCKGVTKSCTYCVVRALIEMKARSHVPRSR